MPNEQTNTPLLDHDMVEMIARRALARPDAALISWQAARLSGGRETNSSIYRIDILARFQAASQRQEITVVLKIVDVNDKLDNPAHWNYCRQEAQLYDQGIVRSEMGGINAPHCYGVLGEPSRLLIWLEYIADQQDHNWTDTQVREVAFALGRFNGYGCNNPLIREAKAASRQWLRSYVQSNSSFIEQIPKLKAHPLVGKALETDLLPQYLNFCAERMLWLERLESLPQTFCHLDIHRGNVAIQMTGDDQRRIVAMDWSFSGIASIGQEIGPLIHANRRMPNIHELAIGAYIRGLQAAGYSDKADCVWWSGAISAALTYCVAQVGLFINNLLDEREHQALVEGFGVPIEDIPRRAIGWMPAGLVYHATARRYFH